MTEITKKEQAFVWDMKAQEAFEALKKAFAEGPVLQMFDSRKRTTMKTDASDQVIRAVLSQPGNDGKLQPVAFYSRKFTKLKLNYKIHNKKLLAIVEAFKQ